MTLAPLSRNPFAAPGLPSLADLMTRIAADDALPLRTGQNWCWALKAVARAAGKEPATIVAHRSSFGP